MRTASHVAAAAGFTVAGTVAAQAGVSKYSQGFEGPDRRFLPVASEFEGQ